MEERAGEGERERERKGAPLEEKRVEEHAGEGERERGREGERERGRERESPLWLLLLYVFSSTWACPMQIGLSKECCLFCLKSSLWSSDLPFTFLVFSDQITSVAQLYPTLCDPMNRSTPGLPVHHQLPEFTETHVHRVSEAIQPSHPLSSPSPPAPNPSQHQSLFQ